MSFRNTNKIISAITKYGTVAATAATIESWLLDLNQKTKLTQENAAVRETLPSRSDTIKDLLEDKKAFNDATQESLKNLKDIIEIVSPPSSNGNNLNVFSSIQEYLLYYQESLNHITEYQKFALIHILASGFILLCLFSLIAVFIGNSLIEYFELSRRWPKLAKYIQIRQKFQTYYFILNSLLIITMLAVIIIINIIAFHQGM
jgi:hypothetical protein